MLVAQASDTANILYRSTYGLVNEIWWVLLESIKEYRCICVYIYIFGVYIYQKTTQMLIKIYRKSVLAIILRLRFSLEMLHRTDTIRLIFWNMLILYRYPKILYLMLHSGRSTLSLFMRSMVSKHIIFCHCHKQHCHCHKQHILNEY